MLGKCALIALLCVSVSVAQVRGNELENAIKSALKRVDLMNEAGNLMYEEVVDEGNLSTEVMTYRTQLLSARVERFGHNSTEAIRKVAAAAEERARETSRPESVFQCIRTAEQKANREINALTDRFETQLERLRVNEKENIQKVLVRCEDLKNDREAFFRRTVQDIRNCRDTKCVNTVVATFGESLDSYYDALDRIQAIVNSSYHLFDNDSRNKYSNFAVQISRIMSAAMKAIRMCFQDGKTDDINTQH